MARNALRARPALEGLEERMLLDGNPIGPFGEPINEQDLARYNGQLQNIVSGSTPSDRRMVFTTPEGGLVTLTLFGLGTLKGTTQDPDGALNIVYDDSNSGTQIIGRLIGGNGHVKLRSIKDADVPFNSLSGVEANQLDAVKLPQFDLIAKGAISLVGGVRAVQLNSIGPATLVDLRSLPPSTEQQSLLPSGSVQETVMFVANPTTGALEVTGVGGLTVPGAISTTVAGAGAPAGFTTRIDAQGNVQLIPIGGTTGVGRRIAPAGVNLFVNHIDGRGASGQLDDPQIFGYDPTTNQLIRFNARDGAKTRTIPLNTPVPASGDAGLGLGRFGGDQVVLVGTDQVVQVFNVLDGAFRGQFTTANLVPGGFSAITGIGETDEGTFLVDGNAQIAQPINVNRSLATGVAVPSGKAFLPKPGFTLSGGGTGVAGVPTGYLTGAATFDPLRATTDLFGVLSVSTTDDNVVEGTPTQVTSPSSLADQVPPTNPPFAFGSIDINPALVTSVDPAKGNTVTIYNASNSSGSSFNPVGSVVLANPNRLTGLSESFHPEITGSALINTRGTLNQIYARSVDGAVVNTLGFLANVRVGRASNSTFLGLPVGHVDIQHRQNVGVYSAPTRPVGKRGGVFILPNSRPIGPLSPPVISPLVSVMVSEASAAASTAPATAPPAGPLAIRRP